MPLVIYDVSVIPSRVIDDAISSSIEKLLKFTRIVWLAVMSLILTESVIPIPFSLILILLVNLSILILIPAEGEMLKRPQNTLRKNQSNFTVISY